MVTSDFKHNTVYFILEDRDRFTNDIINNQTGSYFFSVILFKILQLFDWASRLELRREGKKKKKTIHEVEALM